MFDVLHLHIDPQPHDGAWNMAADQAWLEMSAEPVLRIYRWDRPTVTLGYAQSHAKLAEALPGWPVIRRWTGGGVVLHENDFTYSVIVPACHPWAETAPLDSYRLIHAALAAALVENGHTGCRLAEKEDLIENAFCFVAPALHDVIREKVKISGAGQRRGKTGLLHQGSIQNVKLENGFWPVFAAKLAPSVLLLETMPEAMKARAEELAEKRYRRPEWLSDRDDLL